MALPTDRIKKIKTPNGTTYEIVPERLGKNGYEAALPTLTANSTIALTSNIPTVNNGTLTIKGNGTDAVSFTANQSTNSSLNIKGGGTTTVTRSASGEITISSADQYTGTVTGSSLTSNNIILGNSGTAIKASSVQIATSTATWSTTDDTKVPTMALVNAQLPQVKRYI